VLQTQQIGSCRCFEEAGYFDDPFRVAIIARTLEAPTGTDLLCLEQVFMNHPV